MSTVDAPRAAVLSPYRDWLRTTATGLLCGLDTGLTPDARAVYAGGLPPQAPTPNIVLTKIGLSVGGGAVQTTLVQFDVRADKGAADACEQVAASLRTTLEQAVPNTALGASSVRHKGAVIEGEVALPEPGDGAPRFIVTASLTTTVV